MLTRAPSNIFQMKRNIKQNLNIPSLSRNLSFGRPMHEKLEKDETLCSTDWIKGTTLQFIAFSVNNFSEVNFMMPGEFSGNSESEYKCLFGENSNQIIRPVSKLGGPATLDPTGRTLHLRCKIPDEIKKSAHTSVSMTLGKHGFGNYHYYTLITFKILEIVNITKFVSVERINHLLMANIIKIIALAENIACISKLVNR